MSSAYNKKIAAELQYNYGRFCNTGSARHLETWNTPGYLFGIFQDLENLEK